MIARKLRNAWRVFGVCFLILSCTRDQILESEQIAEKGWEFQDSRKFEWHKLHSEPMDLSIALEHTTEYAYRNIYFFMETIYPDNRRFIDTIQYFLSDPTGQWHGKGYGDSRTLLLHYPLALVDTGQYVFEMRHAMRPDTLSGIVSVGIKLSEREESKQ